MARRVPVISTRALNPHSCLRSTATHQFRNSLNCWYRHKFTLVLGEHKRRKGLGFWRLRRTDRSECTRIAGHTWARTCITTSLFTLAFLLGTSAPLKPSSIGTLRDANQKKTFVQSKKFSIQKILFSNQNSDRRARRKGGGREGRKAGRKEGRREGRKEGRKAGRGRKEGRQAGRKEGRKEGWKQSEP